MSNKPRNKGIKRGTVLSKALVDEKTYTYVYLCMSCSFLPLEKVSQNCDKSVFPYFKEEVVLSNKNLVQGCTPTC